MTNFLTKCTILYSLATKKMEIFDISLTLQEACLPHQNRDIGTWLGVGGILIPKICLRSSLVHLNQGIDKFHSVNYREGWSLLSSPLPMVTMVTIRSLEIGTATVGASPLEFPPPYKPVGWLDSQKSWLSPNMQFVLLIGNGVHISAPKIFKWPWSPRMGHR
jgi:hypothetical protein